MMKKISLFLCLGAFIISNIVCSFGIRLPDRLKADPNHIKQVALAKRLDYTVALAPVTLDKSLTTSQPAGNEKTLQLDTKQLSEKLFKTFQEGNVFKKMEMLSFVPSLDSNPADEAREKKIPMLMNVSIKKARVYYAGKNDASLGNTAWWMLCGIPSFWGADCDYGVDIEAKVSLFDLPADQDYASEITSYDCVFSEKGSLNFLQRSASFAIIIMPPQWCPDNFSRIEELILPDAQDKFLVQLAETTKKQFEGK